MKTCPVESELFLADGQSYMTKLIVAFLHFVKAPKIWYVWIVLKYILLRSTDVHITAAGISC
jgi:hypothetical protein